jgi:hypothetical protein
LTFEQEFMVFIIFIIKIKEMISSNKSQFIILVMCFLLIAVIPHLKCNAKENVNDKPEVAFMRNLFGKFSKAISNCKVIKVASNDKKPCKISHTLRRAYIDLDGNTINKFMRPG